jgi:hypothetical protein
MKLLLIRYPFITITVLLQLLVTAIFNVTKLLLVLLKVTSDLAEQLLRYNLSVVRI